MLRMLFLSCLKTSDEYVTSSLVHLSKGNSSFSQATEVVNAKRPKAVDQVIILMLPSAKADPIDVYSSLQQLRMQHRTILYSQLSGSADTVPHFVLFHKQ